MRIVPLILAAVGLAAVAISSALAEPPAAPAARYELKPVEGGLLRLDRDSGVTAFCRPSAEGYACRPTEDGASADAAMIAALEKRVAALEQRLKEQSAASDALKGAKRDPTLDLPTDEQVDRVASFLERALKRLRRIATDMEKESGPL